jgi:uncharacterized protein YbjT (DUF2867 family)
MKNQQMLVLGGKGKTGSRVVARLNQLGKNVRACSRSTTPAFDWHQPNTWEAAVADCTAVYITFQPDLAVPGSTKLIKEFTDFAVQNGIQKMVLLSGRGEAEAQACEQIVMQVGADWTIVRADWFYQNFSESMFLEPVLAGHVALPRAEAKIAFVDADDIADVVVAALVDDKHAAQIYELTGPRLLTFEQVTATIAQITGRVLHYSPLSIEEYNALLEEHQVPADYRWLINYLFTEVLDGRNSSLTNDVEKVLGRKPKDFVEYAQQVAATGVWSPVTV